MRPSLLPLAIAALCLPFACSPAPAGVVSNCPVVPGLAVVPTDLLVDHLLAEGWQREAWKLTPAAGGLPPARAGSGYPALLIAVAAVCCPVVLLG